MRYFIRSAALTSFVEVARSLALDPYRLLRNAGIDRSVLLEPDSRIPVDALGSLLEEAAGLARIDDFGLRLAQARQLSHLGALGLLLREQPDLRSTLDALARFMRIHNEALSFHIEYSEQVFILREDVVGAGAVQIRQAIELAIGVLFRMLAMLFASAWRPQKVCFSHSPPKDLAMHQKVFGVPVEFDCEFDGIVCALADLDLPMPSADPNMARYVNQYVASISGSADDDFRERVWKLVCALLPSGRCNADEVARNLGVDRRTVHRHLNAYGETFTSMQDTARAELAMRHILAKRQSSIDIALRLGFSSSSAFSRWFTARFGCNVTTWRQRQQERSGAQQKDYGY